MRDFMETMRARGIQSVGQATLNHTDRQTFAHALDRILTKKITHATTQQTST